MSSWYFIKAINWIVLKGLRNDPADGRLCEHESNKKKVEM